MTRVALPSTATGQPDRDARNAGHVVNAARELRGRLDALGLASFPKLTGGQGLHLVVPLEPSAGWDDVRALARAIAESLARDEPARFIATMAKAERRGRIFVDYLRNARAAMAVAPYSTRARSGARCRAIHGTASTTGADP